MAESPTSSLTHTFESLCVGKAEEEASKATDKKKGTRCRKTRRNSDSVFAIDKNKGRRITKGKQSLSPNKLRKEQVEQFLSSGECTIRRRSARRRHTVAEDVPSEDPRPAHQLHQTCRTQAVQNDVTVDDLAGYLENALFIPRPMSSMAEMMYT